MAKKAARRRRRTPEEMIAELEEKIRAVKARAAAKELKTSPSIKRTLTLVRNLDKALDEAAEEGNNALRHALVDARRPIEEFLASKDIELPKVRARSCEPGPRDREPGTGDRTYWVSRSRRLSRSRRCSQASSV